MKYISVLFLAISISLTTIGQDSKYELGVQGGPSVTFTRFLNGDRKLFKPIAAFYGGIFFQYNFNKTFSLRVDPAYEQKGYSIHNKQFTSKIRGNFDYITLPILFRASIGNKIKYFINAGPYIGFLLSQKTISSDFFDGKTKYIYNNTSFYKTIDAGITAGIGVAIPIKEKFALSVEARSNTGLINIAKSSNSNDKTLSANLLIGFSYKFGSKK